jgi:phosphocarrier protein FPr
MAILSRDCICLNKTVVDKRDAIRQCGQLLVDAGYINQNYVKGMLAREEIMSTYLGNGVAIPHGQFDNREDIINSGISVVQIPAGIEWEPGEKAYLVIGIAALRDEHVFVLENLANAIDDERIVEEMKATNEVDVILRYLNKGK